MDDVAVSYDYAETEVIGYSFEGRKMQVIKICKGGCGNKPAIWIDGGILLYLKYIIILVYIAKYCILNY